MRRFLITFFASLFLLITPAIAADEPAPITGAALDGYWQEYSPSNNLIQLTADGKVKILLKKGEIADFHSLDGTWVISTDNNIKMDFFVGGKLMTSVTGKIIIKGDEMILLDPDGSETKHRKHIGELPKEFVW